MARTAKTPIPAIIPDDGWDRTICIPASPLFLAIVAGILKSLTYRYFWSGTTEQIDNVTARMERMFFEYQDQNGDCMDWCQIIADCLSDPDSPASEAVRSIANSANGNGASWSPIYNPDNPEVQENLLGEEGAGCDYDNVWGACISTVTQLHTNTLDLFDKLNLAATGKDKAKAVIGAVPYVGSLGSAAVDLADQISTTIQAGYNAGYTDNFAQDFACELFCPVKESCALSIQDVYNIIVGKIPALTDELIVAQRDPALMLQVLQSATGLITTGYVWLMWTAQLGLGTTLNNLFSGLSLSELIVNTKLSDPNDDWVLLCEDCPPVTVCETYAADFIGGNQLGWYAVQAQWDGYIYSQVVYSGRAVWIRNDSVTALAVCKLVIRASCGAFDQTPVDVFVNDVLVGTMPANSTLQRFEFALSAAVTAPCNIRLQSGVTLIGLQYVGFE